MQQASLKKSPIFRSFKSPDLNLIVNDKACSAQLYSGQIRFVHSMLNICHRCPLLSVNFVPIFITHAKENEQWIRAGFDKHLPNVISARIDTPLTKHSPALPIFAADTHSH
jgi:hypothetical protein